MEKLTKAYNRASINDIMTYSMAGAMALMIVGIVAMGFNYELTNQASETSNSHQSLILGH